MTQKHGSSTNQEEKEEKQVVDFNAAREKRLEEKRKNTERIFFRDLLSVYSVLGKSKMLPVELLDMSEEGCSFQILYDPENSWPKESDNIPLRIYFSREMYLEIFVTVQNSKHSIEKNRRYLRFGCSVDQEIKSYPAYQQFVRFLKLYSEHAHKDMGDLTIFYI